MRKLIATGLLAATVAGGSLAVAFVDPLGIAGAQEATDAAPADNTGDTAGRRARVLQATLDELVADGTITQAQADAIRDRIEQKVGQHRGEGDGRRGHRAAARREALAVAAASLGLEPAEVRSALAAGQTLDALAAQQGVDSATVEQALVDAANARIDQAVADGRFDPAKADAAKARVAATIDRFMAEGRRHGG